mgnify:CR=1 FL=1
MPKRVSAVLNHFRSNPKILIDVTTCISVPSAAGLASSASGYAVLVLALDDLFEWNLADKELSLLARLGSGSASRSLFPGFSVWHQGTQTDGLDSYVEAIYTKWIEFCTNDALTTFDEEAWRENPLDKEVMKKNLKKVPAGKKGKGLKKLPRKIRNKKLKSALLLKWMSQPCLPKNPKQKKLNEIVNSIKRKKKRLNEKPLPLK